MLLGRAIKPSAPAAAASSAPPPSHSVEPAAEVRTALFADPARVDPSDLYPKMKQRALAWNADARLLSIVASPVVGDKVDLSQAGGEIVYVFGTDIAARAPAAGRLALTVRRNGVEQTVLPDAPKSKTNPRAAAPIQVVEPNCVFDAAAKAAHASGVPAATVMKLRYEGDAALRRGVWTATVPGRPELVRVMEGQTCAIVVRR
jgi:hypothetical protein